MIGRAPLITLLSFFLGAAAAEGQKNATVVENVTLPFRAPKNFIIVIEWSRVDPEREYVLLHRDGRFEPDNQHASFENRVELQDKQMKDGDVSLILKDVTTADSGTHKCRVIQTGTNGTKKELSSIIYLSVAPPGPTGGTTEDGGKEDGGKEDGGEEDAPVGLKVCVLVAAVLLLVAASVCVLFYTKHKLQQNQVAYQPPVELQPVENTSEVFSSRTLSLLPLFQTLTAATDN